LDFQKSGLKIPVSPVRFCRSALKIINKFKGLANIPASPFFFQIGDFARDFDHNRILQIRVGPR
jgi:hypothetical protein